MAVKGMAVVYATMINEGKMTIDEVPALWRTKTRQAYFERYGENI